MANGFGIPGFAPGTRATPGVIPSPNSEPVGALTGVPPRTQLYQRMVTADAGKIVPGTPENRIIVVTAPFVNFTVYVGSDASVGPATGVALTPGIPYDITLTGLAELYAVTDAPIPIPVSVQVSIVLMAERQRIVG